MDRYKIVIPSRKRPKQAERALSLIPTAVVYIDRRERDDYMNIPARNLFLHEPTSGPVEMRNRLVVDFDAPALVEVDDDLRGVRLLRQPGKLVTDPGFIRAVIENGVQIATDLNIGLYGWSRSIMTRTFRSMRVKPFSLVAPIFSTYIRRGPARYRLYDQDMQGRSDTDLVLRTLMEDRIVLADNRFYFDHGAIFSGKGGCVDLITADQYERATTLLKDRWGAYCEVEGKSRTADRGAVATKDRCALKVKRRSSLVSD